MSDQDILIKISADSVESGSLYVLDANEGLSDRLIWCPTGRHLGASRSYQPEPGLRPVLIGRPQE